MKTPDSLTREAVGKVQLRTRVLRSEEGGVDWVVLEGDRDSLKYLGELLLAVAEDEDCGYSLSPTGPGQLFFADGSEVGLYLHRVPCTRHEGQRKL